MYVVLLKRMGGGTQMYLDLCFLRHLQKQHYLMKCAWFYYVSNWIWEHSRALCEFHLYPYCIVLGIWKVQMNFRDRALLFLVQGFIHSHLQLKKKKNRKKTLHIPFKLEIYFFFFFLSLKRHKSCCKHLSPPRTHTLHTLLLHTFHSSSYYDAQLVLFNVKDQNSVSLKCKQKLDQSSALTLGVQGRPLSHWRPPHASGKSC